MTLKNAIKKLATFGQVESNNGRYWAVNGDREISFIDNGGEGRSIVCIRGRRVSDVDDSQTDYFAGSFYRNLSQAINSANANLVGN